jgi:hypothetical protein
MYATARDRLRVTADAVLVAKPPFRNEFLLRGCLQREKIGFASLTDSKINELLSRLNGIKDPLSSTHFTVPLVEQ